MFDKEYFDRLGLGRIHKKVLDRERLSLEDGQALFHCPDIHALGALAHHVRTRMHGDAAYYVLNRHINYTNICVNGCLFCAFHRELGQEGGFALDKEDVLEKIAAYEEQGVSEIHIVGGCHPELPYSYYVDLVRAVKQSKPGLSVKAFTAVEIAHFADLAGTSSRDVLQDLKDAGLDMLPGGGAEIFQPEVRGRICPNKISGEDWLRIAGEAHSLGIRTNCTMLFGHLESEQDRLEHLDSLRRQQDKTGGFVCFIPLPFLTAHSKLDIPAERKGPHTGLDQLKTLAVSRLMLDNIEHIKAYWVMLGVKQAQVALHFGADDLDGTVVEEKIGHMAGAQSEQALTSAELEEMIIGSGFKPVRRDSLFQAVDKGRR